MLDPKVLEDLAERLARIVPAGMHGLRAELEDNFRVVLRSRFEKLDLVTRERFDIQAELLARTERRLAALEQRLQTLSPPTDTLASLE